MLYIFVSYCLSFSFRFFLSVCCYAVKERDCAVETNIAVHLTMQKPQEKCALNLCDKIWRQQQWPSSNKARDLYIALVAHCHKQQKTSISFFHRVYSLAVIYFVFNFLFRHSFDPTWEDDLLSINCLGRSVHVILVFCVLFGCMRCARFSVLNFAYHVLFWHDDSRTWINKNKIGKQKYLHTESWKVREA